MSYDLRRLCQNGFLERIEGSHRYTLTPTGRRLAIFFAKTYARVVTPSLAELDPTLPDEIASRTPLARSWRQLEPPSTPASPTRPSSHEKLDLFVQLSPT